MPDLSRGGGSLHYEVAGAQGAPWLFLSHSLGANLSMWEPQWSLLAESFRVVRYDIRGHGRSSVTPGPYTLTQLGEDVLALADIVGAERFHFCGLSMGGLIGQWLALQAPGRVAKLVLANTAAKIGSAEVWDERSRAVQAGGMSVVVEGILQRWFTPPFSREHPETIDRFRSTILAVDPRGYAANCAAIRDADHRELLADLSAPVLVIAGRQDPATTVADGRLLADSIPGARMLELDAAHISSVEQADAFNDGVLGFLGGS